MNFSVLEYLGRVADGILVLISVIYEEEYFEATFFYNNESFILTISEEMEERLGTPIQLHPEYNSIMQSIKAKIVPFYEIWEQMNDINLERWIKNTSDI